MRPRPGVYLAEGTLFATRSARWNSSFHENSGWLWSSKEIKLPVWPFGGASTPVPSSSPPALLRRARRSRSRRRAPRRRHARFQEIIGQDCISFPKVSTASSSCDARSARSLALAMHPATSRRRPRERKVSRLPRRKSPLQQVCQNLQTLLHLMVHCLLLAPRRAASARHLQASSRRRPRRTRAWRSVRAGMAQMLEAGRLQ